MSVSSVMAVFEEGCLPSQKMTMSLMLEQQLILKSSMFIN